MIRAGTGFYSLIESYERSAQCPVARQYISITDLEKMLSDRKADLAKLQATRAAAAKKLDEIDKQIAKMGGTAAASAGSTTSTPAAPATRRSGRRAKNSMSLVAALEQVLKGQEPMKVADIVSGVEAAGYKSSSANFRGIVNQTLIKDKRFASSARGLYHMK